MRRPSIARTLLAALLGLTLALAAVAAVAVSSMYGARQDYEDDLARTYAVEVGAANLLTAGVVEEAVLRSRTAGAAARRRAADTFAEAAAAAARAAAADPGSRRLVATAVQQQALAREQDAQLRGGADGDEAEAALDASRDAVAALAGRQDERRAGLRDDVAGRTRSALVLALVAGGAALLAALGLVSLLVAGLRRPLERLVDATRRLAGGELDTRVEPEGPVELRELSGAFNVMAEDLEEAAATLLEERRRLDAVVASLGDALVICDGFGRILHVNPRAGVLVPELVEGRSVASDPGPLPDLRRALDEEVEVEHRGRTLAVTAARMGPRLEDGVVFTVRDSTERARLERAKSDFVATASHELRSPLTSIKGFVELLGATELTARQREFVDVVALSTDRLVDLVNDLLDVARVESGQLEIQRRPIAVSEAVREVAALMAPRFAERRQRLEVDIAPALPVAWADPARVRQIVTNLMTNAHLYTQEGGRVTVRLGAAGDAVLLSVADDGPGMTAEQVERAFDRFYSGDGHGHGTGLGLSIVRSLVELHGGTVDIDAAPGEGTTVTVRLPRAALPGPLASPKEVLRGRRVLVVEDDPEVARLIAEQLRPHQVEVEVAHSGEAALALLEHRRFDAVTLDILLGGMDGFEVLRRLREDERLGDTPVIVVSVMAGREALAAEWSVSKPVDAAELTEAVGAAILAGRARVLVVGRRELRPIVAPVLEDHGIDHAWATTGAEAARLCEETRFEIALVDAGMRAPQAALAQLDLRGRRLRNTVVVFSTGDDAPGLARLDAHPLPLQDAAQAVVAALRSGAEPEPVGSLPAGGWSERADSQSDGGGPAG